MNEKDVVVETCKRYFQAFQAMEPSAVVPYYDLPCAAVSSRGVSVMQTAAEVETYFTKTMDRLKRLAFGRSEFTELRAMLLSEHVALVVMGGARYKSDGTLLEPIGVTYTLRKTQNGWKVAVLTAHNAEAVQKFPAS